MPFVRVRGAAPGDPLHEFDVPEGLVKLQPDLYEVIDPEPVAKSRPASLIPGTRPVEVSPAGDPPAPLQPAVVKKRPARAKKE
jgi:hypothetical protein